MDFGLPQNVFATTILHGSIALNGVSLTVSALAPDGGACQVAIISPHLGEHKLPRTWSPAPRLM